MFVNKIRCLCLVSMLLAILSISANFINLSHSASYWTNIGSGMDSNVVALAVDKTNSLLSINLYAGGYFGTAGGVSASYIAALLSLSNAPPPILVSPANGAVITNTHSVSLVWSNIKYAQRYDLIYSNSNGVATAAIPFYIVTNTNLYLSNSYTVLFTNTLSNLAAGTYYWQMRGADSNDSHFSSWSGMSNFTINPTVPVLITPANNSLVTNVNPTFTWTTYSVTNIIGYEYWLWVSNSVSTNILTNAGSLNTNLLLTNIRMVLKER